MPSTRILVVDDEADIRDIVKVSLEAEGFEVIEASDGAEALEKVLRYSPQLILLDFRMPKLDGGQVCRTLKKDILLQHLPIVMLTSLSEISDKVHGIESGADDYMVKPFEPQELVARVKMILRRTSRALDANPLTKLPGNATLLEELQNRILEGKPVAVCYCDLDHFKEYNDKYGFEKGDELLKATARILLSAMKEDGTPIDFLGHIGGDDFVLITAPANCEKIAKRVIGEFAQTSPKHYSREDRERGYTEAQDRDGELRRFALMTISVAIVTNEQRPLTHVAEVAQVGAELKDWAKKQGGNRWVRDRRV